MSVVDRLAAGLAARTDRRGFLARSAVVGSALVVNPIEYILKPMTAYAAVCSCAGTGCDCAAACCDGYTDFCCTIHGINTCPPGTTAAGWWKVDGSAFCNGGARYYMDCNAGCGGCGCDASGLCAGGCTGTVCGCALGDCNHRRVGCNAFRYGQCHQEIPCLGPIVCRVVTCIPPWQIDGTCTQTVATDPATAGHDAACLHTPVGALDAANPGPNGVRLTGWALDPDTTDPISVDLYVDGSFLRRVTANASRPDVGAVFPGLGNNHGIDVTVPGLTPGTRQICAYAINAAYGAGGFNPLFGCVNVTVGLPFGFLDSAVPALDGVRLKGWTIDPDTTSPISVLVLVDGAAAGTYLANVPRPDIVPYHPGFGANHGYDFVLPLSPGNHNVCVYAVNQGGGQSGVLLGCRTVARTGNPFGFFEHVTSTYQGARLVGWAIDPDTTGPATVVVVADGQVVAQHAADASRPDVGALFPAFGDNHGFDFTVPLLNGAHSVCAVIANTGPGNSAANLGCQPVTVGGNPIGWLDSATPVSGGVQVAGWAIDPDVQGPVSVQVRSDSVLVATLSADQPRPDVEAVLPGWGSNHGFNGFVAVPSGTHTVCAYAVNQGAGSGTPVLGCRTVTVA